MELSFLFFPVFLQILVLLSSLIASNTHVPLQEFTNPKTFSKDFLFGTASSAYQVTLFFCSSSAWFSVHIFLSYIIISSFTWFSLKEPSWVMVKVWTTGTFLLISLVRLVKYSYHFEAFFFLLCFYRVWGLFCRKY